jgi:hypothetical protein
MSGRTPEPLPPHSPACLPMVARSWRDGGPRYICINTCPRRREPRTATSLVALPGTEPYYG